MNAIRPWPAEAPAARAVADSKPENVVLPRTVATCSRALEDGSIVLPRTVSFTVSQIGAVIRLPDYLAVGSNVLGVIVTFDDAALGPLRPLGLSTGASTM